MYWTVVCVLVVLVASGSACWTTGDDPEATSVAPAARALPSPTPTPEPTASPTPTSTSSPTPEPTVTPAACWRNIERNGEIEGYGYAPVSVEAQAKYSDLVARVRHLSVEPSYRIDSYADPERRYDSYVHFSFGIIETLWGTPPGDVVVVEYPAYGREPTKAQAIEQAKKWIASERDRWWNEQESIIFLDDRRFTGGRFAEGRKSEVPTGAHYRFASRASRCDISRKNIVVDYLSWQLGEDKSFGTWVWLPLVGQGTSLEVPDSQRMFHVVVVPYGANTYEHRIAPASLANIKAILEAHWSTEDARSEYVDRHLDLWEKNGSDSYSFVFSSGYEGGPILSYEKIVVRNGEVVEMFYSEDGDQWGKVWPDGSKHHSTIVTLERLSVIWSGIMVRIVHENWPITDVSFDYEYGYPTAIRWSRPENEPDYFFYFSEYTPLDN